MEVYKLKDYTRGWFVGNFEPSVLKTDIFEVAIMTHKKGEVWDKHIHKISTEYNVLIDGEMTICGKKINQGDIFVINKNEIADPVFIEDCKIVVLKVPSVPSDKYKI